MYIRHLCLVDQMKSSWWLDVNVKKEKHMRICIDLRCACDVVQICVYTNLEWSLVTYNDLEIRIKN